MKTRTIGGRLLFPMGIIAPVLMSFSLPGRPELLLRQETVKTEKAVPSPSGPPGNGALFSAVLFAGTQLGERWAQARPEAVALFPHLKMKAVPDLHMTIVYIGKDWDAEKLALIRRTASLPNWDRIKLSPEIAYFGRNNRVVAIELRGLPEEWAERIVSLKMRLNEAGLKRPETSDAAFRPHITLAEARNAPPADDEARELEAFREWIGPRLDLPNLEVGLGPSMTVLWLLADATRPTPILEYITVESLLTNR